VTSAGASGPAAGQRPAGPARPKLTSRAAVLAVVLCAIALTLAYPVREYIAERREIDQLAAKNAQVAQQVQHLEAEQRALSSPGYIEQRARDDLHMCFPYQVCYEVIALASPHHQRPATHPSTPWYGLLWSSVRAADKAAR
jgi:cell division protein FtsB